MFHFRKALSEHINNFTVKCNHVYLSLGSHMLETHKTRSARLWHFSADLISSTFIANFQRSSNDDNEKWLTVERQWELVIISFLFIPPHHSPESAWRKRNGVFFALKRRDLIKIIATSRNRVLLPTVCVEFPLQFDHLQLPLRWFSPAVCFKSFIRISSSSPQPLTVSNSLHLMKDSSCDKKNFSHDEQKGETRKLNFHIFPSSNFPNDFEQQLKVVAHMMCFEFNRRWHQHVHANLEPACPVHK